MVYERKKAHKLKDDNEAQPITLIMRQYYGNENYIKRQNKARDRYFDDEEFKAYKKRNALLSYYRRKEARLEAERLEAEAQTA